MSSGGRGGGPPHGHGGGRGGGPPMREMQAMPMFPDLEGQDKIDSLWTWWYDDKTGTRGTTSWDENRIQEIGMVGSLQAFWRLQASVLPPSHIVAGATYHFFRDRIKPTWENAANVNGGRWVLFIPRDLEYVNFAWKRILLGLIGSILDPSDHVTGAVCQRRAKGDRITLWIRGGLSREEIVGVGKRVAQLIEWKTKKPSQQLTFDFKAHPADRTHKAKPCADVVGPNELGTAAVDASLADDSIPSIPPETFAPPPAAAPAAAPAAS
mmetsp:Transcript_20155/g.52299  ORF Transcript_20155/g.52299 Transcript_20155/m.52299 type:complete len:267 (+) Transcript_20155:297-1097(+)